MTKNWKKFTAEEIFFFKYIKTTIYLFLGLHKGRTSYKRSRPWIQGFYEQKLEKLQLKKKNLIIFIKNYNLPIPRSP
jgi:hypothetical protein